MFLNESLYLLEAREETKAINAENKKASSSSLRDPLSGTSDQSRRVVSKGPVGVVPVLLSSRFGSETFNIA